MWLPTHILMPGTESQEAAKQLVCAREILDSSGFDAQILLFQGDAESIATKTVS